MPDKDKKLIIILVAILILAIIIYVVVTNNRKKNQTPTLTPDQSAVEQEENVKVLEDGTKLNTSEKFSKTRTVDGLEVSNIQLTESGQVTVILADVINTSNTTKGGFEVLVKFLDKDGKELVQMPGYIDEVAAGQKSRLNMSVTADFANAYDFTIEKK